MNTLTTGELHDMVEEQIINPNITKEIEGLLHSRSKWRKVSNISETFGHVLLMGSTMLAFASGVYKCNDSLSFAAGCINVASMSFLKFSSYASNESSERNKLLNELLIRCNVNPMPQPTVNEVENNITSLSDIPSPNNTPSII